MEFCVRFEPSGKQARVPAGSSLLEAAREAGLPVAAACGASGICARCGVEIVEPAAVEPQTEQERDAKQRNRIDPGLRLACRVRVVSDLTVTAPYW